MVRSGARRGTSQVQNLFDREEQGQQPPEENAEIDFVLQEDSDEGGEVVCEDVSEDQCV